MRLFKVRIRERIEYPHIDPVPDGVHRPFWSVMIPTYNCANYLERTLRSVLEQDPGPDKMQIEVVDDCSTKDDPEAVVKEVGKGRVSFYRQPRNVGISANFTTCVKRARGYWVHILHGDDMVMPGFYRKYEEIIHRYPDAVLITGPVVWIDEDDRPMWVSDPIASEEGPVPNFPLYQAVSNRIATPSVVVPRRVYEMVGGFCEVLSHTADWEMWFRVGLVGQVITTVTPFSMYRVHPDNDTHLKALTGQNIQEAVVTIELCCARLPEDCRRRVIVGKYAAAANIARYFSHSLGAKKHWKGSIIQAVWAVRLDPTKESFKTLIKAFLRPVWKTISG
jgi:glycosyltransferase involved in cell wall biosynthesis